MGQAGCYFCQFGQQAFTAGLQKLAFLGQTKSAAVAVDQAQAKVPFQRADMARQSGLGPNFMKWMTK